MSVDQIVRQQYRSIVDNARGDFAKIRVPPEGWMRTMRKALGMSGAQLARRMSVTRARVAHAEHAELSGSTTLKSMQMAAEAMGCRFVYAIVPAENTQALIEAQARLKAAAIVGTASRHMALESQVLPAVRIEEEIDRLAGEFIQKMPPAFWDDK
jgi:predicted DNA-binding mobile mystery protein A